MHPDEVNRLVSPKSVLKSVLESRNTGYTL